MSWTRFMDMHSGGGTKEEPYEFIYIEAPEAEAKAIFYNRFGHNPERVTCACCGDDYSINESSTLRQATAYDRGCASLETPRNSETMRYEKPDDPWWNEHYYLERGEEDEARARGWEISGLSTYRMAQYQTLDEYVGRPNVLVIRADGIKPEERSGDVPEQGYVWAG